MCMPPPLRLLNKHTFIYKIHQIKLPVSCIEYSFVRKPERVGVSPHLLGESKFSFDFLVGEHFSANPISFSSETQQTINQFIQNSFHLSS